MMQLLGYYLWRETEDSNLIDENIFNKALQQAKKPLFDQGYRQIWNELSSGDQNYIKAVALTEKDELSKTGDIASNLNKKPNEISQYRKRLLDSGYIISSTYGFVSFSLPFFGEYVLKAF
jgi:hypothetical protein